MRDPDSFRVRVETLVAQIPRGRVMTYGQIAALCGNARAARIVGGIAHFGSAYLHTASDCPLARQVAPPKLLAHHFVDSSGAHFGVPEYASLRASESSRAASKCEGCGGRRVPWQRGVNKKGGLAAGYPGGRKGHKQALEAEGYRVYGDQDDYYVSVEELLWRP